MVLDASLFHLVKELFGLPTVDRLARTSALTRGNPRQKSVEIGAKSEHRYVGARHRPAEDVELGTCVDDLGEDEVSRSCSSIRVPNRPHVLVRQSPRGLRMHPGDSVDV